MRNMKKPELLAPAGSFESMKAAVNAGADAVYMGGSRFGARAYAESVEEDMVREAIHFCHLHGRKLYLTVNTLFKEKELEELYGYLLPYYEAGVDAVIVQDLGAFSYIRRQFKELPVHASTQMTLTGAGGAALVEQLGGTRLVTARELSLKELRELRANTNLEIEVFVHGAICYCYSGQCLYSSLIGGRSGNRGRCAQPCRLPYQVRKGETPLNKKSDSYVLNLKDMQTLEALPELIEAGVDSLKIEGRMKSPLYTAGVVSVYRKYVDLYLEKGRDGYRVEQKDLDALSRLFDRGGYTDAYLKKHNGADMLALKEKPAFRKTDEALKASLEKTYLLTELKENLQGEVRILDGFPAKLFVALRDTCVSVEGAVAEPAKKQPLTKDIIEKQMRKLGNTPYSWESLKITLEGDAFLPLQALNELRRNALEALELELQKKQERSSVPKVAETLREKRAAAETPYRKPGLHVSLERLEYLSAVLKEPEVDAVYLDSTGLDFEKLPEYTRAVRLAGKSCYLLLPYIFREPAKKRVQKALKVIKACGLDGVIIRNLEELTFVKETLPDMPFSTDAGLYTWNREARALLCNLGALFDTAPLELNERELLDRGVEGSGLIVYGYLPMMITANCLKNTLSGCNHRMELLWLEDRKKVRFPVKTCCPDCYNIIYNSRPLALGDQQDAIKKLHPDFIRLSFTVESLPEMETVLYQFTKGWDGSVMRGNAYTRGHFKRGVE